MKRLLTQKLFLAAVASSCLLVSACSKKGDGGETSAKVAEFDWEKLYSDLAPRAASLSSLEDFQKYSDDCLDIERQAMMKDVKVGRDVVLKTCKGLPYQRKGQLAVQESTPDVPSKHCMSAKMNLPELIAKGIDVDANTKLLEEVKKACK